MAAAICAAAVAVSIDKAQQYRAFEALRPQPLYRPIAGGFSVPGRGRPESRNDGVD